MAEHTNNAEAVNAQPNSLRTTTIVTNSQTQSDFFSLPAELRNKIYEYTLVENSDMTISTTLKLPPLLQTCSQSRVEASSTWHLKNRFLAIIYDCDSAILRAFVRHCKCKGYDIHVITKLFGTPVWPPQSLWPNLKAHCHGIWVGDIRAIDMAKASGHLGKMASVLNCAQEIATVSQKSGVTWELCLRQLDALKKVAAHLVWLS